MNTLVYTDYDVRPDLLTAEERAQYPEVLSNEDRVNPFHYPFKNG